MTNLTPEAVKAALEGATPGPWVYVEEDFNGEFFGCGVAQHKGVSEFVWFDNCIDVETDIANARLIAMAPDLAREYLRLKEVEKAAHRMQKAWGDSPTGSPHCSATWEMEAALAAFRAAVEGK